jgi:hypothetical protein
VSCHIFSKHARKSIKYNFGSQSPEHALAAFSLLLEPRQPHSRITNAADLLRNASTLPHAFTDLSGRPAYVEMPFAADIAPD